MDGIFWSFLGAFRRRCEPDERLPTWKGEAVRVNHVDPDTAHSPMIEGQDSEETRVISFDSPTAFLRYPPFHLQNTPNYPAFYLSWPPDRYIRSLHYLECIHPSIRHNFIWGVVLGNPGSTVRAVSVDSDNLA